MNNGLTLVGMLIVAVACDWLAVTRMAAYDTTFDIVTGHCPEVDNSGSALFSSWPSMLGC
jgi:hypothetical protein